MSFGAKDLAPKSFPPKNNNQSKFCATQESVVPVPQNIFTVVITSAP